MEPRVALSLISSTQSPTAIEERLEGVFEIQNRNWRWQGGQIALEFEQDSITLVRIDTKQHEMLIEHSHGNQSVFSYNIEDLPELFAQIKLIGTRLDCPPYLHQRFSAQNLELFYERLDTFRDTLPYTGRIYFYDEISEELFCQLQEHLAPQAKAENPLLYIQASDNPEEYKGLLFTNKGIYSSLRSPLRYREAESVSKVTDENLLLLFVNEEPIASLKGYWVGDLVTIDFESLLSDIRQIALSEFVSHPHHTPANYNYVKPKRSPLTQQTVGLVLLLVGLLSLPFKYVEPRQENFLDLIDSYLPFGSILWFIVLAGLIVLGRSLVQHRKH